MILNCCCEPIDIGLPGCTACNTDLQDQYNGIATGVVAGSDPIPALIQVTPGWNGSDLNTSWLMVTPPFFVCSRAGEYSGLAAELFNRFFFYSLGIEFHAVNATQSVLVSAVLSATLALPTATGFRDLAWSIAYFEISIPWIDGKIPCGQMIPRTFEFTRQVDFGANYFDASGATVTITEIEP